MGKRTWWNSETKYTSPTRENSSQLIMWNMQWTCSTKLTTTLSIHLSPKKGSPEKGQKTGNGWLLPWGVKSIDHKNKLYKKTKLRPTDNNKRKYKQYRNILTSCLRTAEETYYINLIQEGKNNLKKLWTTVGDIINQVKSEEETK